MQCVQPVQSKGDWAPALHLSAGALGGGFGTQGEQDEDEGK